MKKHIGLCSFVVLNDLEMMNEAMYESTELWVGPLAGVSLATLGLPPWGEAADRVSMRDLSFGQIRMVDVTIETEGWPNEPLPPFIAWALAYDTTVPQGERLRLTDFRKGYGGIPAMSISCHCQQQSVVVELCRDCGQTHVPYNNRPFRGNYVFVPGTGPLSCDNCGRVAPVPGFPAGWTGTDQGCNSLFFCSVKCLEQHRSCGERWNERIKRERLSYEARRTEPAETIPPEVRV